MQHSSRSSLEELRQLQPTGQGNPPVQVVVRGLALKRRPLRMGRERQHVKFWVNHDRQTCEVVWWNGAEKPWPEGAFDLACAPQINEFNGRVSVQLRFLDWQPAATTAPRFK